MRQCKREGVVIIYNIIPYTTNLVQSGHSRCVKMNLIRLTMFSVKILIGFWILDVVTAEWPLNTIKVMPSTHEFFPDIIRESKSALFLLISFSNVASLLYQNGSILEKK